MSGDHQSNWNSYTWNLDQTKVLDKQTCQQTDGHCHPSVWLTSSLQFIMGLHTTAIRKSQNISNCNKCFGSILVHIKQQQDHWSFRQLIGCVWCFPQTSDVIVNLVKGSRCLNQAHSKRLMSFSECTGQRVETPCMCHQSPLKGQCSQYTFLA